MNEFIDGLITFRLLWPLFHFRIRQGIERGVPGIDNTFDPSECCFAPVAF